LAAPDYADADGQEALRLPKMAELIAARLRKPIVRGELKDGDALPTELVDGTGLRMGLERYGFRAGAGARAYGLLWVHSAAFHEPGDRLSGLDPATGKVVTTSILPAFGMTGLVALGRRLVASSAGGRLLVVTPLML